MNDAENESSSGVGGGGGGGLLDGVNKSKDLSPKSKIGYGNVVKALLNKAGDGKTIEDVIVEHKTYIPMFKKWFKKDTTMKSQVTALLTLFRYNPGFKEKHGAAYDAWKKLFDDAKEKVDTRYETNKPTERQEKGYVPYQDIIKARDSLPVGSVERLLLDMYTYLKPMRCEYARVAIYKGRLPKESDLEPNYIHLRGKKGAIIIRNFKTQKHHDAYDIDLPTELMEDLLKSLDDHPRDWLFVNTRNEPYTNLLYTQWTIRTFNRIFKRPMTVALIRHAYVNEIDFNTMSIRDKRDIATSMGHTIETQDRYRLLFDDKKLACDCVCKPKEKGKGNKKGKGKGKESDEKLELELEIDKE